MTQESEKSDGSQKAKWRYECANEDCRAILTLDKEMSGRSRCLCGGVGFHLLSYPSEATPKTEKLNVILDIQIRSKIREKYAARFKFLQENVHNHLIAKERHKATELVTKAIMNEESIYTIRNDAVDEMWIYDDGIYIPHGKTFIREISREIFGKAFTTHMSNEVVAKIAADTYIDQKQFFAMEKPDEICVQNGILNVITRQLRPYSAKEVFFVKIPVTYDATKTCPFIKQHFETVLKDKDDAKVMFELFGFTLLKEYKMEKAIMFTGGGGNGKTKTLELIKLFLGPDNCVSVPLHKLEDDPYAMGELFHKMANLAGETNSTALHGTGVFKSLTGGEFVSAQRKFLPMVSFVNYAKMIFSANELPRVYDATRAFWRRWVILEFPYSFVSQKEYDLMTDAQRKATNAKIADPEIVKKITTPEEMSGLLNEALSGLKRIIDNHDFSDSTSTEQVRILWTRKSDSFMAFLMDCCEKDYDGKVTKEEMRRAYTEYCQEHQLKPVSDKSIANTLTVHYGAFATRYRPGGAYGQDIGIWKGVKPKNGGHGKDGDGFYTFNQISNLYIEVKHAPTPPNLPTDTKPTTLSEFNPNNKPQSYTEAQESGAIKCAYCGVLNPTITQDGVTYYCDECAKKAAWAQKAKEAANGGSQ